jgi:S1-C subfamily serine protease
MKRYVLLLVLMVACASALIILVDSLQLDFQKPVQTTVKLGVGVEKSVEEVVSEVGPAVVAITTKETGLVHPLFEEPVLRFFGGGEDVLAEREGIGSGVIFDPEGYVLTSDHVIRRAKEIQVTLADGRSRRAAVCGRDASLDIAVIKVNEEGLHVAHFGDSKNLSVGQVALAFGNPFGTALGDSQPSVTLGVVSALHRNLTVGGNRYYGNLIQTDAAINVGNDGGPLVDLSGYVIGINTLIVSSAGASTGVGFAIPINAIKGRLDTLKQHCQNRRAGAKAYRDM